MALVAKPLAQKTSGIMNLPRVYSFSVQNVGTSPVTVVDSNEVNISLQEGESISLSAYDGGYYEGIEIDAETSTAIVTANLV